MAAKKPKAAPAAKSERPAGKPKRSRTDFCIHRRKPEEFCSRCDT